MTLQPFWLGYAVALAVCLVWAGRLLREAEQRDAETTERERCPMCKARPCVCFTALRRDAEIPREAMWRAIERERGE